jgi:hypothetical protein
LIGEKALLIGFSHKADVPHVITITERVGASDAQEDPASGKIN